MAMKKLVLLSLLLGGLFDAGFTPATAQVATTAQGRVQGTVAPSGVRIFKGIPYAAPPVRELRWRAPQPAANWDGIRPADRFGPQCMQHRIYSDMVFRSEGTSEDCLYLNVWTPASSGDERLPVLVYFYGGGFMAGDGSEPRYDGESMAQQGIVAVTMNYRLGIFGFFAHPELTRESPHGASGNYGLLDQTQALRWVQQNIAAFGGDPDRVTIAGESAGSFSVSAQMASPLAKDLIAGAIGESGSVLGSRSPMPLADGEENGTRFANAVGAPTLAALRALSATRLLDLAARPGTPRFSVTVDGYFLPTPPTQTFARGDQARVPLLLGWNSEESSYRSLLRQQEPTPENFERAVRELYDDGAADVLRHYPAATPEEVIDAATALAGDRFIGFSTWKWFDLHRQTGEAPVYRYFYQHPRPAPKPDPGADAAADRPPPPRGAVHSAEIEYALGNLATNEVYDWTADDHKVSRVMQAYFANFIKTGNPNGPGLPTWPAAAGGAGETSAVMLLDVDSRAEPEAHPERYRFLDSYFGAGRGR